MRRAGPVLLLVLGAAMSASGAEPFVRLMTLDPGHIHAALIQKEMYPGVDPTVHVYAPLGPPSRSDGRSNGDRCRCSRR